MKTIVKDRYPVERLPSDIREEVGGAEAVRLTIETIEPEHLPRSLDALWADVDRMHREGKIAPVTNDDAVARIRALRDEWDD